MRSLFAGWVWLMIAAMEVPAAALPLRPFSTPEGKAAQDSLIAAAMVPGNAALVQKAQRALEAGCAKQDPGACSMMATSKTYYSAKPNPQAARQQAATKAVGMYAELCEAEADGEFICKELERLLIELYRGNKAEPQYAVTGLGPYENRLLAKYEKNCRNAPEDNVSARFGPCATMARFIPKEAEQGFKEYLCGRNDSESCHALGRASAGEEKELARMAAQCNGNVPEGCGELAAFWLFAQWSPDRSTKTRLWGEKGCRANDTRSCLTLGLDLVQNKPTDLAAAADIFGKVCRVQGQHQQMACTQEQKIRTALANKK